MFEMKLETVIDWGRGWGCMLLSPSSRGRKIEEQNYGTVLIARQAAMFHVEKCHLDSTTIETMQLVGSLIVALNIPAPFSFSPAMTLLF